MKTDIFTKITLSLIALCLVIIVFQNWKATKETFPKSQLASDKPIDVNIVGSQKEIPVSVKNFPKEEKTSVPLEVKIIGADQDLPVFVKNQNEPTKPSNTPIDVNITEIQGHPIPEKSVNGEVVLPVGIMNTVDANILSYNGKEGNSTDNYGNHREGFPVIIMNR
ncbi:MAG TPA: hypothetical protein VHG71_10425 [Verrucomicrobiae bacterium]|nr:hypothetical protein [Verrucomicrobiae bacterium]